MRGEWQLFEVDFDVSKVKLLQQEPIQLRFLKGFSISSQFYDKLINFWSFQNSFPLVYFIL